MSISGGPNIIKNGLVLYLDAADDSSYVSGSTVWKDISGNNLTGSLTNGPVFSASNKGIISFDGSNDLIAIPPSSFISFSNSLTVSIWVNFNTIKSNGFNHLVIKWDDGVGLEYHFAARNSKISLYLNTSSGDSEAVLGNTTIQTGRWYNLAATWNGSVATAYVNGIFDNSGNKSGTITSTNSYVGIARKYAGAFDPTNCYISLVNLYNRALSADEILQNFNSTKGRYNL